VADELHAARAAAATAAAGSASMIRSRAERLLCRCIRVVMTSCPCIGSMFLLDNWRQESTYALLMPGVRVIVRQMTGAATHGHLRYDIHAKFATHRCASVRVDSRVPMVDRALIADHVCEAEQPEHQVRSEIKI
jgi:hypothetical protein